MNTKTSKKNGSKTKVVVQTRAQVAKTNGRKLGRPLGSCENCTVSLQELVQKLPAQAEIPVSNRWIKMLGLNLTSQKLVSTTKNLTEIVNKDKSNSVASVLDLNTETQETATV